MLVGIDVGGTCTDAVIVKNGQLIAWAKRPTNHKDVLVSVTDVLDEVLKSIDIKEIERVTLSTTIVTNQLVENKEEQVDIFVVSGPGASLKKRLPVDFITLSGYTDHQGKIVERFNENITINTLNIQGPKNAHAVVSAKFAVRNPEEEQRLAQWAKSLGYKFVSQGAKLSGSLNFIRRTNSAYYNAAVSDGFATFKLAVEKALKLRKIKAPLYILKADGGSLLLENMIERPVETVFTGPAASVLGMKALLHVGVAPTVAVDIGGTTTDISLWEDGEPLMARGGVYIKDYPTAVRSFQVLSVGIGGDSWVRLDGSNKILVGPERKGTMFSLGGPDLTLGDALVVLGANTEGNKDVAIRKFNKIVKCKAIAISGDVFAMQMKLFNRKTLEPQDAIQLAEVIVATAINEVNNGVNKAISEENKKPIYVVEDIIAPKIFKPSQLVAVGGTAQTLGKYMAKGLGLKLSVPKGAEVANAVGAAVAKASLELTVRVNTNKRILVCPELGLLEKNTKVSKLSQVIDRAKELLHGMAVEQGIDNEKIEVILAEEFPIIQGWSSKDYIYTVKVQLESGVCLYVKA